MVDHELSDEKISDWVARTADVPGWFTHLDARLIVWASERQLDLGIHGDLLEIGVYRGKSAILFAGLRGDGERFWANDVFESGADTPGLSFANALDNQRWYQLPPSVQDFRRLFESINQPVPDLIIGPSRDCADLVAPRSCRLIHVDGAHDFDTVKADLAMCSSLLRLDGLLIVDDICAPHVIGVAAAVWDAVSRGLLSPALFTDNKMYCALSPDVAASYAAHLSEHALTLNSTRVDQHPLFGRQVARVVPRPAPHDDWYAVPKDVQ